jgi:hypothetical protein
MQLIMHANQSVFILLEWKWQFLDLYYSSEADALLSATNINDTQNEAN